MNLVQLLRIYNHKPHPKMDDNLIYIQHSHNKEIYTSIGKSPFEAFFGYLLDSPLDVVYGQQEGVREDTTSEALTTENFH